MRSSSEVPPSPGEVLRNWQHGACDWLQNFTRSAQKLQQSAIHESAKAVQHLHLHHAHRHARPSRHAAFASLSGGLPARSHARRPADKLQFSGKGMNCIISDLADSSISVESQKGPAGSKAVGEEQERILVSEVNEQNTSQDNVCAVCCQVQHQACCGHSYRDHRHKLAAKLCRNDLHGT